MANRALIVSLAILARVARAQPEQPLHELADVSTQRGVAATLGVVSATQSPNLSGVVGDTQADTRTFELDAIWAVGSWCRALASLGAASGSTEIDSGGALGNVRLGALLGTSGSWVRAMATLPTGAGQGNLDAAARTVASVGSVEQTERFAPGGLGAALDGIQRFDLDPGFVQLELGVHALRSEPTRDGMDEIDRALWVRAAAGAGIRTDAGITLAADVVGTVSPDIVVAAHAAVGGQLGMLHLAFQAGMPVHGFERGYGWSMQVGTRW